MKEQEQELEKSEDAAPSFEWPSTSLSIPTALPILKEEGVAGGDGGDSGGLKSESSPPQTQPLLRVAAYGKRTIGNDLFVGVGYVPVSEIAERSRGGVRERTLELLNHSKLHADGDPAAVEAVVRMVAEVAEL